MDEPRQLISALLEKIVEQIERADHLMQRVPPEKLDWRPLLDAMTLGHLLGHLLETLAGFCAVLAALRPADLSHLESLRALPVNHSCGVDEARGRLAQYRDAIIEGFQSITDEDLARLVPTVFRAEGEAALTLLLGNFEHLVNHKYQLFFYLKLLGLPVESSDLYRFR